MPAEIRTILEEMHDSLVCEEELRKKFIQRIDEGMWTRDENPDTHINVMFAPYDPEQKKVFLGHHIKADLHIFTGGHIDQGETARQALIREMQEEWGFTLPTPTIPQLVTFKVIDNPRQRCTGHFDIWYFFSVKQNAFKPDHTLLNKEFSTIGWITLDEADSIVTDPPTMKGIARIKTLL